MVAIIHYIADGSGKTADGLVQKKYPSIEVQRKTNLPVFKGSGKD
ncbi:MAG: hypothetical protein ABI760_18155 [Ferruginibacter sp.]